MNIFKCKMCGGNLEVDGNTTVATCEFCETTQTIPVLSTEKKVNLFNRANTLRGKCEFDKAEGVYEQIIAEEKEEPEAYWGMCLCKYGIEYIDDPLTARKIPTCHRTSFSSILDDEDFLNAIKYSTGESRDIYQAEAKEIDRIQKEILEIVRLEKPYDVFICYKETASNGGRTEDSVIAQDIYESLTAKGFKVFFARITLEDKLGSKYEPYIFAALNSAKVMLVIGTKEEYFNAVWVKNEWSRFIFLSRKNKDKMLIPCYKYIDPYEMPMEFSNLQGLDMSKIGFKQDLIRGIEKVIGTVQVNNISYENASAGNNVKHLLKRVQIFMEDSEWQRADEYCERVLDSEPENGTAYFYKFLCSKKLRNEEELYKQITLDTNDLLYKKARKLGDEYVKACLDKAEKEVKYNNLIIEFNKTSKIDNIENALTAYQELIEKIQKFGKYKNLDEIVEKCKQEILRLEEESRKRDYNKIISDINVASNEKMKDRAKSIYENVIVRLKALGTYNNSQNLLIKCEGEIKKIEEEKIEFKNQMDGVLQKYSIEVMRQDTKYQSYLRKVESFKKKESKFISYYFAMLIVLVACIVLAILVKKTDEDFVMVMFKGIIVTFTIGLIPIVIIAKQRIENLEIKRLNQIKKCNMYSSSIISNISKEIDNVNEQFGKGYDTKGYKDIVYELFPMHVFVVSEKNKVRRFSSVRVYVETVGGYGENNIMLYYKNNIDTKWNECGRVYNSFGRKYYEVRFDNSGLYVLCAKAIDENRKCAESYKISIMSE